MADNETRATSPIDAIAFAMVAVVAFAIPWEIFQRVPFVGLRITSAAAIVLIPCAVILWWKSGRPNIAKQWLWPIAFYILVCLASWFFTTDAEASVAGLMRLAAAIVFFAVMAIAIDRPARAHSLMALYACSAAAVGALAWVCASVDLVFPAGWQAAPWFSGRVAEAAKEGVPLRLSATRENFDIATLEACVGIAFAWFAMPDRRGATVLMARLCAIGLIAVGLFLAAPFGGVVEGILGASIDEYVESLQAIIPVVGQCAIFGCGIGAAESAIEAHAPVQTLAIPNTLVRVLIETGVIGAIAIVWLIVAALRSARRVPGTRTVFTIVWIVVVSIIITRDIPLITLCPFLFAMAFGPRAESSDRTERLFPMRAAIAIASLFVIFNFALFQWTTAQVVVYTFALDEAASALNDGDTEQAKSNLSGALYVVDELGDSPPYGYEAETLAQLDQAYRELRVPVANPSNTAAIRYALAMTLLARGEWEAARDYVESAVGIDGDFRVAHYALAEAAWRDGRFEDALIYYSVSPMPSPTTQESTLQTAAAMRRAGDWESAVSLYREFAKARTSLAEVWFNLGVAAELEGDWPTAKAYYERALQADPNHLASQRELRLGE